MLNCETCFECTKKRYGLGQEESDIVAGVIHKGLIYAK